MRTKTRGKRGVFGFGFLLEPNGYLMDLGGDSIDILESLKRRPKWCPKQRPLTHVLKHVPEYGPILCLNSCLKFLMSFESPPGALQPNMNHMRRKRIILNDYLHRDNMSAVVSRMNARIREAIR